MRLLILGATMFGALVSSSSAADMAVKAPPRAPASAIPAAYNWTGCYVGGNIGGAWATKDWTNQTVGAGVIGAPISTQNPSGVLAGGQFGCNYQTGSLLFGIQGDAGWSNASGNAADQLTPGLTDRSKVKSLASITGRVGYAWDRVLGYVKGGGAWARDEYSVLSAAGVVLSSVSETRSGWTLGVGIEYAFLPNWSTFAEYDYYDFGTRNLEFPGGGGTAAIRQKINVAKAGINYKFW